MSRQKRRKIYVLLLAAAMIVSLMGCGSSNKKSNKTMRVGVVTYTADDPFINAMIEKVKSQLKTMETTNMNVIVSVRSGDNDQREQDEIVDEMIDAGCDVLCVNLVDRTAPANIIKSARQSDIPVIFFNREPVREDIFRSDQIYYEGSDAKQSAILQADVIADALEKNRSKIDRNGDGVIQFAMLEGESGHQDTLIRSEWVLKELENKKIPTQQIAGSTGNWEKNQANVIVRQWMKEYPNQIEVIISNNDDMALGAWEALEEKGCTEVQVVGIDGIEEVRELVDEDKILGSVLCDTKLHAKALMQFIDVLAFHNGSVEKLNLENERYYMIPLTKVEK